ncbi:condensin complex subunit SMC2 [Clavulina sp. PMI_390]|nr:condensin complex subunit SMC2 [Clavulina sp. PMI_390]
MPFAIIGFKSYPVRTTIAGWDASFNAITGLNGSGKSNILDAICFVLGITNMQTMRAQNQQDLIYKRGQAGVVKASVTIVFDNSDKATSPPGFENTKQITLTRQIALPNVTKYILNGHKVQQQAVLSLLQSVQLNINNPNFVIMQGRITKVCMLNMRPQEILGMMEEAAGTRMFEDRKEKAKRTMGKKEKRVEEINELLREEITPKLDKLREQKRSYLTYQKATTELERLARFLRAYDWVEATRRVSKKDADIVKTTSNIEEARSAIADREAEGAEAEKERARVEKKRDKELAKGGKLKALEEQLNGLVKELTRLATQAEIKEGALGEERKRIEGLEQSVQELRASLDAKRADVERVTKAYDVSKEKHSNLQTQLATSEELLQTLTTGLSSSNNASAAGGYLGQLADAKARMAAASTEEEQSRMRMSMLEKELKDKELKWKAVEKDAGEGAKSLARGKKEVEALQKKLDATGWNEAQEAEAVKVLREAREAVRSLTEERDALKARLGNLDFSYSDPSPNFDRSKVKGLVATLVDLPEGSTVYSTALEVSAGGKLYNVVVDDETVGTQLLKKGNLKKRVTIIPLNKVNPFTIPTEKLNAAAKVAPNKAHHALSLVGYPEEVTRAMAYVFGDSIICRDPESAKAVTFNKAIGVKTVTVQGDVYDPSGTMSGGSAPSGNGVLLRVQELNRVQAKLAEAKASIRNFEDPSAPEAKARSQWSTLKRELEIKQHELALLEEQVEGSNASRIGAEVEALKKALAELKDAVAAAKAKQKEAKQQADKFERDMNEFKNNKESKLKELKGEISKQKAALSKHAAEVKLLMKELQNATLELEQTENDIETSLQDVKDGQSALVASEKELKALLKEQLKLQESHDEVDANLKKERANLSRFDEELNELDLVIKEKRQAIADAELQVKALEHQIGQLQKDRTAAQNVVASLEKGNPWIEQDKQLFGKAGTMYDFGKQDPAHEKEKALELENQLKGLKKNINPKVMGMIETVEKKEADLLKMLSTVVGDKEKIEETIEELERHKRKALQTTWEKVDKDFGGIFGELLPGNFAKLQPPEGMDLTQGLEVKVRLGSVWKQSLTELSGGQRSLIALSLIMAMLQFKPAPMYILDEIDAALDLSHTQHIGQLFKNRFKGSQFIVVSLKEGLFTNANVLFRTQFRDGTSVVQRTAQRSASGMYDRDSGSKENRGASSRTKS